MNCTILQIFSTLDVSHWIQIIQAAILFVTAIIVYIYTQATKNQTDVMIKPVVMIDHNDNLFKSPYALFHDEDRLQLPILNIGKGIAFNIEAKIQPTDVSKLNSISTESYLIALNITENNKVYFFVGEDSYLQFYAQLLTPSYYQDYYRDHNEYIYSEVEIKYVDVNKNKCYTKTRIDKNGHSITQVK